MKNKTREVKYTRTQFEEIIGKDFANQNDICYDEIKDDLIFDCHFTPDDFKIYIKFKTPNEFFGISDDYEYMYTNDDILTLFINMLFEEHFNIFVKYFELEFDGIDEPEFEVNVTLPTIETIHTDVTTKTVFKLLFANERENKNEQ